MNKFFEDINKIYLKIQYSLKKYSLSNYQIKSISLTLIMRLLFLQFLSCNKKNSLLKRLWESYINSEAFKADNFYTEWLKPIFFRGTQKISHLLPNDMLKNPWLKNGVFLESNLDKIDFIIEDNIFSDVLSLFEKYEFYIGDNNNSLKKILIIPDIIEKINEYLLNKNDNSRNSGQYGIYYTPDDVVDFMTKVSLTEYLSKNLPNISKKIIYNLVYDKKDFITNESDKKSNLLIVREIENILKKITILDLTCGSGAFLISFYKILLELRKFLILKINGKNQVQEFNLKKQIIQNSIYGVDAFAPAILAFKLRIIIDILFNENVKPSEFGAKSPLEAEFKFNLKVADSLLDVNIFENKKKFDIIIGNPPYVNHKKISPPIPDLFKENQNLNSYYKSLIVERVKKNFPNFRKISKINDYYVYFFFSGIKLLKKNGVLCYITSNAWLDTDYGKDLQEFLLKFTKITAIYDNPYKSFSYADVNTIISLIELPNSDDINEVLEHQVKFIMFKKDWKFVNNPEILYLLDNFKINYHFESFYDIAKNIMLTENFRIIAIKQNDLFKIGKYNHYNYKTGKWGGRFLRAPDIYFKILERGKKKFLPLYQLASLKTGIKKGGYSKYIVPAAKLSPDKIKIAIPIIKNPRMHNKINISDNDSYIIKNIEYFRKILKNKSAELLWLTGRGLTHKCQKNVNNHAYTGNYIGIEPFNKKNVDYLLIYLNSTLCILMSEIIGRSKGIGGGAAVFTKSDLEQLEIFDSKKLRTQIKTLIKKFEKYNFGKIHEELGIDISKEIKNQQPKPIPIRSLIDNIIFEELNLNKKEICEIYLSVCELIKNRYDKAKSKKFYIS
ncbi:MAG: Eco57I restriction-modification methylase domain-containing protein [Promethearchaeota archaeon]